MLLFGPIGAMKQSLEQNRAMLKSRKSLKKRLDENGINFKKSPIEIRKVEISNEEMELIREKIRLDAEMGQFRWNVIVASMVLIGLVTAFFILFR